MRFVAGQDRNQSTLYPELLDDYVGDDNPVRAIDVFVDELRLGDLSFGGVQPQATGGPAYHPATLLKLYVYGYLNRVQSIRRLERECQRNIELIWLTGRLAPDFKTIADFRKDNGDSEEILACEVTGISVCLPKPTTSAAKADGRFDRQDFVYVAQDDFYRCPAGERLTYRYTREEAGRNLRRYWTSACQACP